MTFLQVIVLTTLGSAVALAVFNNHAELALGIALGQLAQNILWYEASKARRK